MSRRTEVCRDFVRGSCRFGSRCKFLHDSSQQQRQQPSNPFGFGVKNQGQQQQPAFSKGGNYYAPLTSTQRQQKNQSQTQVKEHRCSDPRECKLQITEDLQNEQPVYWRLTSYAHGKYLPNDVTGDVSFEELRNYAYDAGKQGMLFENVVQNERNMLIAKNMEFEILLKNPYTGPTPSGNSFQGSGTLSPFASAPSDAPKMLFGTSAPSYSSLSFGESSHPTGPSQDSFQSRGAFGGGIMKESGGFSFGLGASSTPANAVSASIPFTSPSLPASGGFSFGVQSFGPGPSTQLSPPQIAFGSNSVVYPSFGQNTLQMSNSVGDTSGASRNLFGSKDSFQGVKENEIPSSLFSFQNGPASTVKMSSETLVNQTMRETTSQIMPAGHPGPPTEKSDIWLKESWALGEIPDEEPPVFAR